MRHLLTILAIAATLPFAAAAPAATPATLWAVTTMSNAGGALVPAAGHVAATDASGNLFVAGTQGGASQACIVTIKYSSSTGAVLWRRESCGGTGTGAVAIAVDGSGHAVVAGNVSGTFRLIKYSGANGAPLWDHRFDGHGLEVAHGMALDRSGDVMLMGQTIAASSEIWIARHRGEDGAMAWQQPVDAGTAVTPAAVAVDGSGNAFVTGTYLNSLGHEDWHLAKLAASSGAVLWRKLYDSGGRDFAAALAVDAAGDAIVVGTTRFASGASNIRSVKNAGATGRTLWDVVDGGDGPAVAGAVRADGSGNVIVTGSRGDDIRTLKYSSTGALAWQARYAGTAPGAESGRAIAIDAVGNIAVTGRSYSSAGAGAELRTIKYAASNGAELWSAAHRGSGPEDSGHAVLATADAVYAVGLATGSGGAGLLVAKYGEADQVAPSNALNVQGLWWNAAEPGWGVNLTQQGNVLFATWFTYDAQGQGMWLVMSNGERVGDASYAGTLYRTTGPGFNAVPFEPARVSAAAVGTASFSFDDGGNGVFRYTVDGIAGSKAITRQVYSAPVPACTLGGSRDGFPNYQDLWWATAGSESGWGLNVTHQGDLLFVTWFTYGPDGRGMWIVGSALARTGNATYEGTLYRTVGPPFSAQPWDPARVGMAAAGHAKLAFRDDGNGTFDYTLDGITQSKGISRQVFAAPATVCR
ncbi:MAG TPA: hypothetical protein VEC19_18620 [Usitatibacter sp.]|nr:hypothetical protein [Usitatibacter sp.]